MLSVAYIYQISGVQLNSLFNNLYTYKIMNRKLRHVIYFILFIMFILTILVILFMLNYFTIQYCSCNNGKAKSFIIFDPKKTCECECNSGWEGDSCQLKKKEKCKDADINCNGKGKPVGIKPDCQCVCDYGFSNESQCTECISDFYMTDMNNCVPTLKISDNSDNDIPTLTYSITDKLYDDSNYSFNLHILQYQNDGIDLTTRYSITEEHVDIFVFLVITLKDSDGTLIKTITSQKITLTGQTVNVNWPKTQSTTVTMSVHMVLTAIITDRYSITSNRVEDGVIATEGDIKNVQDYIINKDTAVQWQSENSFSIENFIIQRPLITDDVIDLSDAAMADSLQNQLWKIPDGLYFFSSKVYAGVYYWRGLPCIPELICGNNGINYSHIHNSIENIEQYVTNPLDPHDRNSCENKSCCYTQFIGNSGEKIYPTIGKQVWDNAPANSLCPEPTYFTINRGGIESWNLYDGSTVHFDTDATMPLPLNINTLKSFWTHSSYWCPNPDETTNCDENPILDPASVYDPNSNIDYILQKGKSCILKIQRGTEPGEYNIGAHFKPKSPTDNLNTFWFFDEGPHSSSRPRLGQNGPPGCRQIDPNCNPSAAEECTLNADLQNDRDCDTSKWQFDIIPMGTITFQEYLQIFSTSNPFESNPSLVNDVYIVNIPFRGWTYESGMKTGNDISDTGDDLSSNGFLLRIDEQELQNV